MPAAEPAPEPEASDMPVLPPEGHAGGTAGAQPALSAEVSESLVTAMLSLPDGLLLLDRGFRVTFGNPQGIRLSRIRPNDLNGPTLWQMFPSLVGTEVEQKYRRAMEEGTTEELDQFYEPFAQWFRVRAFPVGDGIAVHFADITALRTAEEEHAATLKQMRRVLDATTDTVLEVNHNWTITYMNRAGRELTAAVGDVVGKGFFQAFPGMVYPGSPAVKHYFAAMSEGTSQSFADSYGAPLHIQVSVEVRPSAEGIVIFARDVTRERTDEAAMRAEQAETERQRMALQAVYDTAPVGLALFDAEEFRYLKVNQRHAETIGLPVEAILGKRVTDISADPQVRELFQSVAAGRLVRDHIVSTELVGQPGQLRHFNVNYSPVRDEHGTVRAISGAVLDITRLKLGEAALVQSEKLAAVGRLAASISHEINNPLEAVTNLLYLSAGDPLLTAETRSYLTLAQDELARVSQIATQTLRFHRQADSATAVTAAQLVDPVLNLYAGRLLNSRIQVETDYCSARPMLCFENDIRQVLNNLIANAIDAMRTGGRLLIRAHNACDFRSGTVGVRIAVADTGHGMKSATVCKIFEPFYTTKGMNGNGLGLWISKGLVERHQGHLRVRSSQEDAGHGTVFTMFLPGAE